MNVNRLNAALSALYHHNKLIKPTVPGSFGSYAFLYEGRVSTERLEVMPALTKKALDEIVLGAINGSLNDMALVASMYAAGFALSENIEKAEAWAQFSMMAPAHSVTYQEACAVLKEDRRYAESQMKNGLAWPPYYEQVVDEYLSKLNTFKPYSDQQIEKGAVITPRLKGLRINLIYRAYKRNGKVCAHLYGAFHLRGGRIDYSVNELRLLGIPIELGEVEGRRTITDYVPFGAGVKLHIVQGTIVVPKDKIAAMREAFPDVNTTSELFDVYLKSVNTNRISDFSYVSAPLTEKKERLLRKISRLKKKDPQYKKLSKSIEAVEQKLSNIKAVVRKERTRYLNTLPETYLKFVATDMFVYQNRKIMTTQAKWNASSHLQSLGFYSLTHPLASLDGFMVKRSKTLSGSELDNIINKFSSVYNDQYSIAGLTIRPYAESVNIKKCFSYVKSKETPK